MTEGLRAVMVALIWVFATLSASAYNPHVYFVISHDDANDSALDSIGFDGKFVPWSQDEKSLLANLALNDTKMVFTKKLSGEIFSDLMSYRARRVLHFIKLKMLRTHGSLDDALLYYYANSSFQSVELALLFGADPMAKFYELCNLVATQKSHFFIDELYRLVLDRLQHLQNVVINHQTLADTATLINSGGDGDSDDFSPYRDVYVLGASDAEKSRLIQLRDSCKEFTEHCAIISAAFGGFFDFTQRWATLDYQVYKMLVEERLGNMFETVDRTIEQEIKSKAWAESRRLVNRRMLLESAAKGRWNIVRCISRSHKWDTTDAAGDQWVFEHSLLKDPRFGLELIVEKGMRLGDGGSKESVADRMQITLDLVMQLTINLIEHLAKVAAANPEIYLATDKGRDKLLLEKVVQTTVFPQQVEQVFLRLMQNPPPASELPQPCRLAATKFLFTQLWARKGFRLNICHSLGLAAENNQPQMVEFFVKIAKRPSKRPRREQKSLDDYCPRLIMHASRSGSQEMVDYFVRNGAFINYPIDKPEDSALFIAVEGGFHNILDFLLAHDARLPDSLDYEVWCRFWEKVNRRFIINVQNLRRLDKNHTYLFYLIAQNDQKAVEELLHRQRILSSPKGRASDAATGSPKKPAAVTASVSVTSGDLLSDVLNEAFEMACVTKRFHFVTILRTLRTRELSAKCVHSLITSRFTDISLIIGSDDEAARIFIEVIRSDLYAPSDIERLGNIRRFRLDLSNEQKLTIAIMQKEPLLRIILKRPEISPTWLLTLVFDQWKFLSRHWDIIKWLFAAKADPNGLDGRLFVRALRRAYDNEKLFFRRFEWTKMFLENGANINVANDHPLRLAVEKYDLKMVQLLIDRGAGHLGMILKLIRGQAGHNCIRNYISGVIIQRVGWWNYMLGKFDNKE